MEFKDKVVVVTGASSGMGRSLAKKFSERGAKLVLAARNEEKLNLIAKELNKDSRENLVCVTDVSSKEQVEKMIDQTIDRFKRIDILINCAGFGMYGRIAKADLEQIRYNFEVNFFAVVYAIQKAYPLMVKQGGGYIVNISSTAGFRAWPDNGYYCASKHALNAITDSLMLEARSEGVKILSVMPGTINTDFIANSLNVPDSVKNNPPMDMDPDQAAEEIIRAMVKNKKRVVLTNKGKILYLLNRISPSIVDKLLQGKTA
jgi:short-subunit dehydrogenase